MLKYGIMIILNSLAELTKQDHDFFNLTTEVNQLISPLINHFQLNSFNYVRTYADNSQIRLSNSLDWLKYYLSHRLYLNSMFELPIENYHFKSCLVWANLNCPLDIINATNKFDIFNGVTFINPIENACEFYSLGTNNKDPQVVNNYLSNLDLFDCFINQFQNLAKPIFEKIYKNRVYAHDWLTNTTKFRYNCYFQRTKFLTELYNYDFTARELEYIPLLLKNLTTKQIAENLLISYRTVEDYINKLKIKTATKSKTELIAKLNSQFRVDHNYSAVI